MTRAALLTSLALGLALGASCKKETTKSDLPPASDWQAGAAPAGSNTAAPAKADNPHAGADNPHAGADNPHAGMDNPHADADNPHAGMDNPHAGMDNPHAGVDNPHAGMDNPHAGMAGNPHGSVPSQTAPKTPDKLPNGRLALGPFSVVPPSSWTTKPVTSNMRVADFQLPGKPGAEAELIVYFFGSSGAGSVDDNVNRWLDQFQQPDGKSSRDAAKIEKTQFGGQDATYVSVAGRYVSQGMPGGGGPVDKADQALLAAIITSPSGPYYFKLVGAKPTVDAQAKAFRSMLQSLKLQ